MKKYVETETDVKEFLNDNGLVLREEIEVAAIKLGELRPYFEDSEFEEEYNNWFEDATCLLLCQALTYSFETLTFEDLRGIITPSLIDELFSKDYFLFD